MATGKTASAAAGARSSIPRYIALADTLTADIRSGHYAVGSLLPPEIELAAHYGVSRYTAREAMRRLDEQGLISRRAGIGTTVKAAQPQSSYSASISDLADLVHFTKQTQLKILSEQWVRVSGELARVLPDAEGQKWLRFCTLRYPVGGKEPISHTEIVVHPSHAEIRARMHEPNATVYRLIEELHGERIREVRQEISCVAMPRVEARLLGVAAGTPALHVLRYYIGRGERLLSVSINLYPQDRFKLSTRWRLDRSGETPAPD